MLEVIEDNIARYKPISGVDAQGWGHVYLPPNLSREDYIAHCKNNYTVCLMMENALFYTANVRVPKNQIDQIEFPESSSDRGSLVWYNINPRTSFPTIVNIYAKDKDNNPYAESYKNFLFDNGSILGGIDIDKDGNLTLFSDGEGNITIKNKNGGSLAISSSTTLKTIVRDGIIQKSESVDITAGDLDKENTKIYFDKDGFKLEDKSGNIIKLNEIFSLTSKNKMELKSDNILSLNKGTDVAVLYTPLLASLNEIVLALDALVAALALVKIPGTSPGSPSLVNPAFEAVYTPIAVQIQAIAANFAKIPSQTIYIS